MVKLDQTMEEAEENNQVLLDALDWMSVQTHKDKTLTNLMTLSRKEMQYWKKLVFIKMNTKTNSNINNPNLERVNGKKQLN